MFTGIIQTIGSIEQLSGNETDKTFIINAGNLPLSDVKIGDSIAINGVCLTVTVSKSTFFNVDVSHETLLKTTLSNLKKDSKVNLEKAMTPSTPFGGHMVSGHVDGVGSLISKIEDGACFRYIFKVPASLAKYIAIKGSITINGVSLTINGIKDDVDYAELDVLLIPHTEKMTNLGELVVGDDVNLEIDMIARYVERLLMFKPESKGMKDGLTLDEIRTFGL